MTIVVKELAAPKGITKISQFQFSPNDIAEIVGHFNANLPKELTHPEGLAFHQANLVIVTEAMIRNAIEKFDGEVSRN